MTLAFRNSLAILLLLTILPVASRPANAQPPAKKDIPAPDPALELATFRVPEGFEVQLYAADPAIAKPIQMNFDEDGRLWIASSEVYPQIVPGAPATDRILVVEDTDHNGVADRTHVFAEGLLIPTGVAPGDGGAWVANSTELVHFADTDGDLKADSKRVVLSGFGTEDTHHILHTLRWGYDGYLYFNQSIYIHSHVETPWGVRRLNAGGIWQFRPDNLELGVFLRGLVNTWGHHFDRWGQSFATDGAGGEGINYVIPGGYYFTAADAERLVRGLNPGSPKHCGLELVDTPMLPPTGRETPSPTTSAVTALCDSFSPKKPPAMSPANSRKSFGPITSHSAPSMSKSALTEPSMWQTGTTPSSNTVKLTSAMNAVTAHTGVFGESPGKVPRNANFAK
ncbi:MAG UNVERIFIED_CONTAM: hypothetical protein LVR18_20950 [Planctomycetaceae bacterium]|jgi:hypothetical protein